MKSYGKWIFLFMALATLNFACQSGESDRPPDSGKPATKPQKTTAHKKIQKTWIHGMDGLWVERPASDGIFALDPEQQENIKNLQTIGYLAGYKPPPSDRSGVTHFDRDRAQNGLNLIVSGHNAEAILVDMEGNELHRWRYPYDEIKNAEKIDHWLKNNWRRAYLYENGDLLAIYEDIGLIKIDKESNLIWYLPCRAHHDIVLARNKDIYVLTRELRIVPEINEKEKIVDDFITRIDPDGKILEKISILECINNSPFQIARRRDQKLKGDIFHTNTLEIIQPLKDSNHHPALQPGNVLISMRNMNCIGVIDIARKKLVMIMTGGWRAQHEPQLLANGDILLFDNSGYQSYSRILEVNPMKAKEMVKEDGTYLIREPEVIWEYTGVPPESFFSRFCGTVQRLPNGNTLITETCSGKAFEVNREKEILWEFINPHRAGDQNELIAAVLDVVRLSPEFPASWIEDNSND